MLSYTHMFELIPKEHKQFCATFINTIDTFSLSCHGFYYMLVEPNAVQYVQLLYFIGTFSTIIYLLIIPESPRWLLQNGKDQRGIKVMNYIAWFNRSDKRIPSSAKFDLLEEAVI